MFWSRAQLQTQAGASPADLEQGASPSPRRGSQLDGDIPVRRGRGAEARSADKPASGGNVDEGGRLEPSEKLTRHQLFYVLVLDGFGGMVLSGGVNFALAYVMYTTQDTVKSPIRLFQLPNTLAGDAAVTIIVQCILTWFVEKGLVAYDLSRRSVQPIGFIPKPTLPWQRRLFFLPASDTDIEDRPPSGIAAIIQQALRGFLLAVVGFVLLWPAGVGILTALGEPAGGDYTYADRWTPQIFKLILGGVLGLLTTPLMAAFWLIKAGWEGKSQRTVKA
ncbi:hypothetical protein AK830_g3261 [Neonectria ditissima]|uniref:Uncharacterized protein n=1 Tax=Neonectria ditissima TaxID=78410 RepID=A0A0N8H812_9HYPO|nr:hypothetical protein AK830_g3261 [Neonectria ditissima]